MATQTSLFGSEDRGSIAALDQLFHEARAYRATREYTRLLCFIRRFTWYAPFNCLLLHMQNPGVRYVATPGQWRKRFGRRIKDGARPLVILAPMSPVLFVYDVTDTEGEPIPPELLDPFPAKGQVPETLWLRTLRNCARDLVCVVELDLHPNHAGYFGKAEPGDTVLVPVGKDREGKPVYERSRARYRLRLNKGHNRATQYATLAHELAHLYCGHLGTPNERWWPSRLHLSEEEREFEAESAAYLVCGRLGIENPAARYLAGYLRAHDQVPEIGLDGILKAAGLIERMGWENLKPRKQG